MVSLKKLKPYERSNSYVQLDFYIENICESVSFNTLSSGSAVLSASQRSNGGTTRNTQRTV